MWWGEEAFELVFDPGARAAPEGYLLVGLGDPQHPVSNGVALNHKSLDRTQTTYRLNSVSEYILRADAAQIEIWRARLPHGPASIRRIVVEDLSFDTCFALLLFFDRTGHHLLAHTDIEAWVRYVSDWEVGIFNEPGAMRHSAAVLITMLGHSYLTPTPPVGIPDKSLRAGLRDCLSLLRAMLDSGMAPATPVPVMRLPEYGRAQAQFEYEAQQYRLALSYGQTCQLMVPLADGGRRVLVDALILDEVEPSGILKLFARTDVENSWTRKGFALLAIHRPSQAGTGNDMSISIDPTSGLTLRKLWVRLERLENLAWGKQRPQDAPRRIASYRLGDTTLPGAPNEPWWDDGGRYTLIGAPKRLLRAAVSTASSASSASTGHIDAAAASSNSRFEPGSRLQWRQHVLRTLWTLYRPIPSAAHTVATTTADDRRLAVVRWQQGPNLAVAESPTFHSWLASRSMPRAVKSPLDLPAADEFELLRVPGGLTAIHHDGVTLFDDWRQAVFDLPGLSHVADEIGQASSRQRAFLGQKPNPLEAALAEQEQMLGGHKRVGMRQLLSWKHRMTEDRHALLKMLSLAIDKADGRTHTMFRQGLIRHWGLSHQREHMLDMMRQLDDLTRYIFEDTRERQRRLITALAAGIGSATALYHVADALGKPESLKLAGRVWHQAATALNFSGPQLPDIGLTGWTEFWASAGLVGAAAGLMLGIASYLWWGKPLFHE